MARADIIVVSRYAGDVLVVKLGPEEYGSCSWAARLLVRMLRRSLLRLLLVVDGSLSDLGLRIPL